VSADRGANAARRVSGDDAEALLVELVSTPSPSGEEDAAAEALASFLRDHGRAVERDAAGNVRAPGDDAVLLTSHVDTVPGEVPVRVEDGVLWGRGSVDATGALAAMAVASVETGVSFAGVVGEETDSRGARHLVSDREAPEALINGEPSGWDAVTLGYRGLLSGTYAVETAARHSSRPEPNAVERAMAWWERTADALAPDDDAGVFDSVTAKPVAVDGGPTDDGLAVAATVDAQFRLPPGAAADDVRSVAEAALDAGSVTWQESIPPVVADPRSPVASAFRAAVRAAGGDPSLLCKSGTSDMNLFAAAWDCPMATYGPGDSEFDHAPDERLPLDSYRRAISVLTDVCDRLA
jgi:LysW-gamma-L-lysine carboxypeptidase